MRILIQQSRKKFDNTFPDFAGLYTTENILSRLEPSVQDYTLVLLISEDNDFHLYLM